MRQQLTEISGGQLLIARDAERGSFLFVDRTGGSARGVKFVHVPDTVDPRGGKGKWTVLGAFMPSLG
jgi:hypothetical protein